MDITTLLDYVVVPLFLWVWVTDRKVTKLEATQITKEDLDRIYNKLDLLYSDMHKQ